MGMVSVHLRLNYGQSGQASRGIPDLTSLAGLNESGGRQPNSAFLLVWYGELGIAATGKAGIFRCCLA